MFSLGSFVKKNVATRPAFATWAVAALEPRPRLPPWPLRRLGGLTLAHAGFVDFLQDALHDAMHDSTNVMSSTIGELFTARFYIIKRNHLGKALHAVNGVGIQFAQCLAGP